VTHPKPTFLRFVLGGNDLKIYPGFNGQFTRPVVKVGYGSFINDADGLKKYAVKCNPQPGPDCTRKGDVKIIQGKKKFEGDKVEDITSPDEFAFPNEYGVSGWFKWTPTK
jgi:hypothetical protein